MSNALKEKKSEVYDQEDYYNDDYSDDVNYSDDHQDIDANYEELKDSEELLETKFDKSDFKDHSIRLYLDDISKYKLLTHEEEIELSKKIMTGDKDALNHMINSNLRLVVKIAKQYVSKDYPLIDLIQDGNLGLIKAAKKYDFRKNVRFSTYASWWIKQTIVRSLSVKRRVIRIPHRKEEKLRKIKKTWHAYYQKNKKNPTNEEIASILNMSVKEVNNILSVSNPIISLETNINDENYSLNNLVGDKKYKPEDILFDKNLQNETSELLNSLFPKEKMILICRYGFQGGKKFTLKKMGKYFGISAETVRQIELKALKKLKNSHNYMKDYITDYE